MPVPWPAGYLYVIICNPRQRKEAEMFKSAMKVLSIGIFAAVIGYFFAISTQSPSLAARGIQYKVIVPNVNLNAIKQLEDTFNKMGAEGWELVSWMGEIVVFKR